MVTLRRVSLQYWLLIDVITVALRASAVHFPLLVTVDALALVDGSEITDHFVQIKADE